MNTTPLNHQERDGAIRTALPREESGAATHADNVERETVVAMVRDARGSGKLFETRR